MAKPFTWDFEPRSVAFKLQLPRSRAAARFCVARRAWNDKAS